MNNLKSLMAMGAGLLLSLVAGCGGESAIATDFEPKGEGSIPIGRAVLPRNAASAVQIRTSDGRVYSTVTREGTVFAPCLAPGPATVIVTPFDPTYHKDEFQFVIGTDRHWNFTSRPVTTESCPAVRGINANLTDGKRFRKGESFNVVARVISTRYSEAEPTVIVSGGVGRMNVGNRVLFTQVGVGKIIVEACGIKREFRVVVQN